MLGPQGRIVIPIEIRRKFGLEPGTVLNIWAEDGKVHLRSRAAARASAKKLFKDARGRLGGENLVDELIAERRAEAARELADED
ncbi:AbrB/MazE/SpoVT family DNA-binding domain-containing protein [Lacisediminihabitans sp.]|uniref:AbrB/MazE/SpoVT family DNA-binding domain-containing protein n=1 Tax=Lacisediminihabitans sp. TaxID=2787631 RepID=UPI002F957E14